MLKRTLLAIIAIFVAWTFMDFIIHGVLLQQTYANTANLWRPMEEMNMLVMHAVTLAYSVCFVLIYAIFVDHKSMPTAISFGALFGLAAAISMGFGSYSYMPIPLSLALTWFCGTLVESIVAGALAGLIIKQQAN